MSYAAIFVKKTKTIPMLHFVCLSVLNFDQGSSQLLPKSTQTKKKLQ